MRVVVCCRFVYFCNEILTSKSTTITLIIIKSLQKRVFIVVAIVVTVVGAILTACKKDKETSPKGKEQTEVNNP